MIQAMSRLLAVAALAIPLALLGSCASTSIVDQWQSPTYTGTDARKDSADFASRIIAALAARKLI